MCISIGTVTAIFIYPKLHVFSMDKPLLQQAWSSFLKQLNRLRQFVKFTFLLISGCDNFFSFLVNHPGGGSTLYNSLKEKALPIRVDFSGFWCIKGRDFKS